MRWTTFLFLAVVIQVVACKLSRTSRADPVVVTDVCLERCYNEFCILGLRFKGYCEKCKEFCQDVGEFIAPAERGDCIQLCTPKYPDSNGAVKKMKEKCKEYCKSKYKGGEPFHVETCLTGCTPRFPIANEVTEKAIDRCNNKCADKGQGASCKDKCKPEYNLGADTLLSLIQSCVDYCHGRDTRKVMYRDNVCIMGCTPGYPKSVYQSKTRLQDCKNSCLVLPKPILNLWN